MDKIQIKNVRSLKDTGWVKLSPITLLVGENSSGKSTFLRLFPLIKQSITKRTDGPLLWAGDADDYVDFGSFTETVTNDGSSDITFCFSFSTDTQSTLRLSQRSAKFKKLINSFPPKNDIHYSITVAQESTCEYISKLNIQVNHTQFSFDLTPHPFTGKIVVDSMPIGKYQYSKKKAKFLHYSIEFAESRIFEYSLPFISDIVDQLLLEFIGDEPENMQEDRYIIVNNHNSLMIQYMSFIGQCLCLDNTWEEIRDVLYSVDPKADVSMEAYRTIIAHIDEMEKNKAEKVLSYFKLLFFYDYFVRIEEYLENYFRQVHYIAPLRATAERYYRLRNLAIDEVDYQGKNLAIFLSGLPEARFISFQEWTQQYFGFYVETEKSGGHLSVKIALKGGGNPVNMSDTGFGYSQILPIITQLWDLSSQKLGPVYSRRKSVPLVIAIEQPELHLHPALQARLAKAFLASIQLAKDNGHQLQLLIETHSETIVNYFGWAIAEGILDNQDVSVVLFDKNLESRHTQVRTSSYDQDGLLSDWPVGFFSAKEW